MAHSDHNKPRHHPFKKGKVKSMNRTERRKLKAFARNWDDSKVIPINTHRAVSLCGFGCCW